MCTSFFEYQRRAPNTTVRMLTLLNLSLNLLQSALLRRCYSAPFISLIVNLCSFSFWLRFLCTVDALVVSSPWLALQISLLSPLGRTSARGGPRNELPQASMSRAIVVMYAMSFKCTNVVSPPSFQSSFSSGTSNTSFPGLLFKISTISSCNMPKIFLHIYTLSKNHTYLVRSFGTFKASGHYW